MVDQDPDVSILSALALLQVSIFVVLARWATTIQAARSRSLEQGGSGLVAGEAAALAEAERTAQLGSYAIDLDTGETACSSELRRILDLGPGQVVDTAAALLDCIDPADREIVSAAWEKAKGARQPVSVEHRIVHPDGAARWIDGRVRVTREGAGRAGRLIGTMQDVSARRAVESALAHQALHDSLTGLPNRAAFLGRLAQVMAHRQLRPSGLAVFFLDIDRFKWLNDSRGHAAGDELLVKVGRRLLTTMRPGDTVARFGGDEFVVLCEDVPSELDTLQLADRLASVMRRPVDVGGEETSITVSIGIAFLDAGDLSMTSEALVRDADAAMYEAKVAGRDRHEIFDASTRAVAAARHETVEALRLSVEHDQFVVHYQPILDLASRRLVGYEALVRWDRPGRGLQLPEAFLAVAEDTGLTIPIGSFVLGRACRQVAEWQVAEGEGELIVSVNLTRRQLLDPELGDVIERALVGGGLLPSQLHVEITESILLNEADASARAISRLRLLGISVAVDDFGSCFSSLTFLKQFPVDVLKIDRAFVKGLGKEREDRAIVTGVVDLAHAFGLTTVAEGVETLEQLDELRAIGCEQGQGFLWSHALPADEVGHWLRHHHDPNPFPVPPAAVATSGGPPIEAGHRVLVVDDDRTYRQMLRLIVESGSGYRVVGEATDGREAIVLAPGAAVEAAPGGPSPVAAGHRVLVVDDDRTYRQMLRLIVESGSGYRVVGEATDGREAIALARNLAPDVILLDLVMPGMGGLEALPLLLDVVPAARVVVLSSLEPAYLREKAGGHGAAAFCTKVDAPDTLLEALDPAYAA